MKRILIVGAGFTGAVIARQLAEAGFKSLVVEKSAHVAGHCYTERDEATGVMLHKFGPHIFNTDDEEVWRYVQRFGEFRPYINRVKAVNARGVFSFPINLHTINQLFRMQLSPEAARSLLSSLAIDLGRPAANFEEQALATIGEELYEVFIKHYTRKAWGRDPKDLPASVLKRLPVRFDYNDNYYDVRFQAIPIRGYTEIVARILKHSAIGLMLETSAPTDYDEFGHVFYTGPLDAFFGYSLGRLNYRTLDFERVESDGDIQGTAVLNFTDDSEPFTRASEHKHFAPWETHARSVALIERPRDAQGEDALYYPLRTESDRALAYQYQSLAAGYSNVTFCGRLGRYEYLDMDDVIRNALDVSRAFIKSHNSRR